MSLKPYICIQWEYKGSFNHALGALIMLYNVTIFELKNTHFNIHICRHRKWEIVTAFIF